MKGLLVFSISLLWLILCMLLYKLEVKIIKADWWHDPKRIARWEKKRSDAWSVFFLHDVIRELMIVVSACCVYIPSVCLTVGVKLFLERKLKVLPLEKNMVPVAIVTFLAIWITLAIVMCRSELRKIAEGEKANKKLQGKKKRDEEYFSSRRFEFWLFAMSDLLLIGLLVVLMLL